MSNKQLLSQIQQFKDNIYELSRLQGSLDEINKKLKKTLKNQYNEHFEAINANIQNEINTLNDNIQLASKNFTYEEKLDSQEIVNDILDAWNKRKADVNIYNWIEDVNSPDYDEDKQENLESKAKHFNEILGTNFKAKEFTIIEVVVETNSRSDLWLVRAYLAPGFSDATFDTGRVGWGLDIMLNSDFRKALKHEISQNS